LLDGIFGIASTGHWSVQLINASLWLSGRSVLHLVVRGTCGRLTRALVCVSCKFSCASSVIYTRVIYTQSISVNRAGGFFTQTKAECGIRGTWSAYTDLQYDFFSRIFTFFFKFV